MMWKKCLKLQPKHTQKLAFTPINCFHCVAPWKLSLASSSNQTIFNLHANAYMNRLQSFFPVFSVLLFLPLSRRLLFLCCYSRAIVCLDFSARPNAIHAINNNTSHRIALDAFAHYCFWHILPVPLSLPLCAQHGFYNVACIIHHFDLIIFSIHKTSLNHFELLQTSDSFIHEFLL